MATNLNPPLTVLVDDSASGGGLLDRVTSADTVREDQIAFFIRQLLQAVQHLHSKNIVHLDLKPENIMLSDSSKDQIKLTDFGLSRKLRRDKETFGTLGAPEFVSPEVVMQKPVTLAADMWTIGVLSYVMTSGVSPLLGDSDKDTLQNVVNVDWNFDPKHFVNVSEDAKDFISKLMLVDPKKRMTVNEALSHPWMQLADSRNGEQLSTKFLKEFKYRHQWVERRVFMQKSPDDENIQIKSPQGALQWMEPLYFPPPINNLLKPSPVLAPQSQVTVTSPDHPAGDQSSVSPKSGPTTGYEHGLDPSYVQGEWRSIEDEIANRILSDISEEGSVASTDDLDSDFPSRKHRTNREKLVDQIDLNAKLGTLDGKGGSTIHEETDGEKTPTLDDSPVTVVSAKKPLDKPLTLDICPKGIADGGQGSPGAPHVIQGLHSITHSDGQQTPTNHVPSSPFMSPSSSFSGKSPIRRSPTKEQVMEVIIAAGSPIAQPNMESTKPMIPSPLPEKRTGQSYMDKDFDRLMNEVEGIKADFQRRRKEIQESSEENELMYNKLRRGFSGTSLELGPPPEWDVEDVEWDSTYQTGPETYLLALRNPGLSSRIRDYRRSLFGDHSDLIQLGFLGERNLDISVRERRRYTDVVKDDAQVAKTASVLDMGLNAAKVGTVRRVRSDVQVVPPPPSAYLRNADGEHIPVFRSRLRETLFSEDSTVTFQCHVVGVPEPEVTWLHNDSAIAVDPRHQITFVNNKACLTIFKAFYADCGMYTCAASNQHGQSTSSARLKMGDLPERPSRPDVELASDTEVFITWDLPVIVGGLDILGYKLEYRKCGENDYGAAWQEISDNIDEEAVVLRHLECMAIYQFRVTAKNHFGFGSPSLASRIVRTHQKGAPKLNVELLRGERHLNVVAMRQSQGTALGQILEEEEEVDAEAETNGSEANLTTPLSPKRTVDLNFNENPTDIYQLENMLFKGRMCLIREAVDRNKEQSAHCVAKIILATGEHRQNAIREYEMLRKAQHEHVAQLLTAYVRDDFVLIFMERMRESLLDRFTYRDTYTEEQVGKTMLQVASGLQWLHFKGIVHLDVQPENIMFTAKRTWNVKLVDFGSACELSCDGTVKPKVQLNLEWTAPEILLDAPVSPAADMWGVGVITYLLLSGFHPFASDEDTAEDVLRNICEQKIDLNYIHTNASQESLRFIAWALKKEANRRMDDEEAMQHRWLSSADAMYRRRENIKFSSNRLRVFSRGHTARRLAIATNNNQLLSMYGNGGNGSVSPSGSTPLKRRSSLE